MESGTPVEEGHVPVRKDDGVDVEPLMVKVDGLETTCFISGGEWRSSKVILVFESPHPKLGEDFGTKKFRFGGPGVLEVVAGGNAETLEILHR